ncbi:MAG: hypothetical protein U5O69_01080, partial [Candidatus Competibacteraceae bacterium]|nr:hypothetical protein [Candidatus Competibacteraceae bacterium]
MRILIPVPAAAVTEGRVGSAGDTVVDRLLVALRNTAAGCRVGVGAPLWNCCYRPARTERKKK